MWSDAIQLAAHLVRTDDASPELRCEAARMIRDLAAENARLNRVIASAVATFRQYKMSVDDYPTAGHRAFMAVVEAAHGTG